MRKKLVIDPIPKEKEQIFFCKCGIKDKIKYEIKNGKCGCCGNLRKENEDETWFSLIRNNTKDHSN